MIKRYLKTPEDVVDALQSEKIVTDGAYRYRLYKGIIVGTDGYNWDVSPVLDNDYNLYVEEPKLLKLEVGKFYKTRDGRKALVYGKYKETNEVYPYTVVVVGEPMSETCVSKAGKVVVGAENIEDLVAPWEE